MFPRCDDRVIYTAACSLRPRPMFPVEKRVAVVPARPRERRPLFLTVIAFILVSAWFAPRIRIPLPRRLVHVHVQVLDRPQSSITWTACPDNSTFYCAFFPVPLDYDTPDDSDGDRTVLAMRMFPATVPSEDRLGSIFTNPGGPGGSGHANLLRTGPLLSEIFEGRYDILSWDPRGVNLTTPRVSCFPTDLHRQLDELSGENNLDFNPSPRAVLKQTLHRAAARADLFTALCRDAVGDKVLRSVTTPNVARDLEEMRSALGEGGLKYWGFSYGTTLGATYVAMFPEQAERVILDGVVYAPEQYTSVYDHGMSAGTSTNGVFAGFVKYCGIAGPGRCALATNSSEDTSTAISTRIWGLYEKLAAAPLPVPTPRSGFPALLTREHVIDAVFSALYRPKSWAALAEALADAEKGDGARLAELAGVAGAGRDWADLRRNQTDAERAEEAGWTELVSALGAGTGAVVGLGLGPSEAGEAVSCGDAPSVPMGNETEWLEWLADLTEANPLNGPSWFAKIIRCSPWDRIQPTPARYLGDWKQKPKNPVVFISNSFDPITPIASGRRMVDLFGEEHARLLTNDGYGHCSTNHPSTCIAKALRAWVTDGVLFERGTVCQPDQDVDLMFPVPKEEEPRLEGLAHTMRLLADADVGTRW
ncbi:hypothetical protein HMN09_00179000 [Mycena chlorophos]|uniref:AB hydrolase-1 domain-containing protein n=1 Tax=Mycena chlorophos TaxID=658473 RepID=A0A8H6TL86_MYCCL|nr:hypothetical protein HMN09_00179000 [Mycena chlorophos]